MEDLEILIRKLLTYSDETQWFEFKHNNYDPQMIGKDICALANSAALEEKSSAYFVWGINNDTHEIIGTNHTLQSLKKGKEELENWLRSLLSPNVDFICNSVEIDEKNVEIIIITPASGRPVTFEKTAYVRVGSYTKKLQDCPGLEKRLWSRLQNSKFEEKPSKENLLLTDALSLLAFDIYFDLIEIPRPSSDNEIAHYLLEDGIIIKQDNGQYAISNMGAILFAKRLKDFPSVARKAIRIAQYSGKNRLELLKENVGGKGYVVGFEGLMDYLEALIPSHQDIIGAVRTKSVAYPMIALREAIANALIHQDFSITGTGPTLEIFENRIEITNSGIPLVDILRIIDNPPKSRNEKMASLMRRLRMCEELGTGWDKIVISCELAKLPAPMITEYDESTKVTFYSEMPFASLSREDKLWACYLHACIQFVQGNSLTNSSLRERFGVESTSSGSISRLIKEAVCTGLIKPVDPATSNKYMKYIPGWA